MGYFTVEPETAGAPVAAQSTGGVEFRFDGWLGDDMVRAHPAVLVRTEVKNALLGLDRAKGFEVMKARVRTSRFFRQQNRGKRLPRFWVVDVSGRAGRDDMGLMPSGTLVVSRRVLDVLLGFRIRRAVFAQYTPWKQASRRSG
jgi:hypothetical protein